ncbi:rubrerythrin family protein [Sporolactobacillus shoreae]|uniref:Rubrerythrin family protein n=1 Tax=Sporolactobacillus shoreae TaxID=1465501 RepID=A0A4Z0GK75_9BACL|nr:ferritin family protein [Sporolactobacillus shoreae]TGA97027.1 rubrerythrin family protein [Sporolactobacillus shoreae]
MMEGFRPADPGMNGQLIERLRTAITGEYNAIHCYEVLMNQARTDHERRRISEIRGDEMHHFQVFSSLYQQMTGETYQPQQTEACPNTYMEGLRHAIEDEQNTVDFYMETGDMATNEQIKSIFYRIAKDEQNHAVWFLYFYALSRR